MRTSSMASSLHHFTIRLKHLPHLTVHARFMELVRGVVGNSRTPEGDCGFVVQKLRDQPSPRKAIENKFGGIFSNAQTPGARGHEKFSHAIVDLFTLITLRAAHQGETDGTLVFKNDQRVGTVICEPASHQLCFTFAISREHPGVHAQVGQIVEVLRIMTLNPNAIGLRVLRISDTDRHCTFGLSEPSPVG